MLILYSAEHVQVFCFTFWVLRWIKWKYGINLNTKITSHSCSFSKHQSSEMNWSTILLAGCHTKGSYLCKTGLFSLLVCKRTRWISLSSWIYSLFGQYVGKKSSQTFVKFDGEVYLYTGRNWAMLLNLVKSEIHTVCEGVESITVYTELLQLTDLWQLNTNQVKK